MNGNNKSPEKKQVLNAKQLQLVGRHFQLCKKLPNIPPRNGRNFCYSHPSRVDRKSFSTSSQCDVICDFWCAHKFPQLSTSVSSSEKTTMNSLWWWDLNLNRQRTFASSQAPTLLAVTAAQKNVSKKSRHDERLFDETRIFTLLCSRSGDFSCLLRRWRCQKFLHGKNIQNPARSVRKKNKDERWFFFTDQQENENFFIAALQIDCFSFWVSRRRSWAVARVTAALSTSSIGEWRNQRYNSPRATVICCYRLAQQKTTSERERK